MKNSIELDNVLMQELKLVDILGNKMSITFGDVDITGGYSYGNLKFLITDDMFTMDVYKNKLNLKTKTLLISGKKVWSENCQGPNTGMNADLLDGKHGSEFKDIYGTSYFKHMFKTTLPKSFIKVATFTTRRVGNPNDFNTNGESPYRDNGFYDINAFIGQKENINNFISETNYDLKDSSFHSVGATTPGIFNASLRATIAILNNEKSTTFDLHLGIFEDPLNKNNDAWVSTNRYFFTSLHNNDLPFIEEKYDKYLSDEVVNAMKVSKIKLDVLSKNIDSKKAKEQLEDIKKDKRSRIKNTRANVTPVESYHEHSRPQMDKTNYATPPDPSKDYVKPDAFKAKSDENNSYGKYLDVARLYYNGHHIDEVDGVQIVTQIWDLYIAVDKKSEVHLMPIQSSGCSFTTFREPVSLDSLADKKYIRPRSIYDDRYSHREHRHYDYEKKIWDIIENVDQLWDTFDSYIPVNQGGANKNKILMTDETGRVFANEDNLERHKDDRRRGNKVLITSAEKCLVESSITASELAQLSGVNSNIQQQIDELISTLNEINKNINNLIKEVNSLKEEINNIKQEVTDIRNAFNDFKQYVEDHYVKKSGDSMTGNLTMKPGPTSDLGLIFQSTSGKHNCKIYGGNESSETSIGAWDSKNGRVIWRYCCDTGDHVLFGSKTISLGGKKVTVSSTAPAGPSTGDVWIKSW